jgi:hypothetical protein
MFLMIHKKLILIVFLTAGLLVVSACSVAYPAAHEQDSQQFRAQSIPADKINSVAEAAVDLLPDNMIAFQGQVFVASTRPKFQRWYIAGWKVAKKPIRNADESVPADCTLYPHLGVEDQWIGSCSGFTSIPRDGANHIAVVHTDQDGTMTLVQVAPPIKDVNP